MTVRYQKLPISHVRDAGLRTVLGVLEEQLAPLFDLVRSSFQSDPQRGIARLVAPVIIPEIPSSPQEVSSLGQAGQLVRQADPTGRSRIFIKKGNPREDTDWDEVSTSAAVAPVFYQQATEPAVPAGPGFWEDNSANPSKHYKAHDNAAGTRVWRLDN